MALMKVNNGRIAQSLSAPFQLNQNFRPSKCTSSAGALKTLDHIGSVGAEYIGFTSQDAPANGDKLFIDAYCQGTETQFHISTAKEAAGGIWDLYINDELDSAGYDEYAAALTTSIRNITLTKKPKAGYNLIEIRVNGKNALSTNYYINISGVSMQ